ncbi:hypothetical protein GCM10020367_21270 [Streptomyces sannanensis]|uniref:Small CPxCG-related zinc finger protein n=1 Tax=Streptomyces sannanensis TaxID=285536 RepID=A0ABP6S954_9ACTN
MTSRTDTPPRRHADGTTYRIKRPCNGCGQKLRDANEAEILAVVEGRTLPDVRHECPNCRSQETR